MPSICFRSRTRQCGASTSAAPLLSTSPVRSVKCRRVTSLARFAPMRAKRKVGGYGTTMTAQGARLISFWDTLPSSSPVRRPLPRRPITMASTFSSIIVSKIAWVGSPERWRVLTGFTPVQPARCCASCRSCSERSEICALAGKCSTVGLSPTVTSSGYMSGFGHRGCDIKCTPGTFRSIGSDHKF